MKHFLLITCISICNITIAHADQNIEIIGGNSVSTPPIAIMNFTNNKESGNNNIANIIATDFNITGDVKAVNVNDKSQIDSKVQYIVSGIVNSDNTVAYTLKQNNESGSLLLTNKLLNLNKNARLLAHTISNQVYQKLTSTPGIFTSKIAYIAQDGDRFKLIISDYDGYNPKILISTKSVLSSLARNPNGSQIAYVSYEPGKPVVYVQDIYKPRRYLVANFSGSNSSPAFTDDGLQLSVTLTKDNGSHVYLIDNAKYTPDTYAIPLENFGTIDTEASMGKNNTFVFTSNHDGGPQIFMASLQNSHKPKRVTVDLGRYNTTGRLSHDLSKIIFIRREAGSLRTYIEDLATSSSYPVSINTNLDLAPSFAPNDKLILFSSDNTVYLVNTTGTTQTKLNNINYSQIIDQRWSNNF